MRSWAQTWNIKYGWNMLSPFCICKTIILFCCDCCIYDMVAILDRSWHCMCDIFHVFAIQVHYNNFHNGWDISHMLLNIMHYIFSIYILISQLYTNSVNFPYCWDILIWSTCEWLALCVCVCVVGICFTCLELVFNGLFYHIRMIVQPHAI